MSDWDDFYRHSTEQQNAFNRARMIADEIHGVQEAIRDASRPSVQYVHTSRSSGDSPGCFALFLVALIPLGMFIWIGVTMDLDRERALAARRAEESEPPSPKAPVEFVDAVAPPTAPEKHWHYARVRPEHYQWTWINGDASAPGFSGGFYEGDLLREFVRSGEPGKVRVTSPGEIDSMREYLMRRWR